MKKIIFKTITILLIVAGAMACKKEKDETLLLNLGLYVETYPTEGYTQINLIDREKLSISEYRGLNEYHFVYVINEEEDNIKLTDVVDSSIEATSFYTYFKILTDSKFEIVKNWGIRPLDASPPVIMTFEKENN